MKVAVAIIIDEKQRILITQRPFHVAHGGFWEFPGGKLEPHESPEDALLREIREELGIIVNEYRFLGYVDYDYPDKHIQLIIFMVTRFTGNPLCQEGQLNMKWVKKEELNINDFPKANHAIFDLIDIPELQYQVL
ncbi:TPA: 8-oxo-dGTP diphosphatase MutT [Legionella pneumophila subsp. pneumophila]|uniref:8-oxo-dGTP diphosphatase MutT n=1 Tax=Legionella pneumophila TaxID=446 RepID=UPI00047F4AFA|nr:8-oxo-dGTP diphosphatase MutT [Legionella pneumophila]OOK43620.1 mutator protein MutT [Legionella pneumophila subsp. pneumophila str. Mississauga]CZH42156.1 8-oxo-dGTP diphosphatase [Legionella pneumophila]CZH44856.1 8-oxo-dGTP diphosphatase [Legionella pneumophila]STY13962.1 mutator MutT protein [Legionella pneumophila]GAN29896.1 8-oxo-dGTP diphosphatase [Legionella pneumophila]